MTFVHPERLWLLTIWASLALWAIWARWRRRRGWKALAQRGRPPREGALWWLVAIAGLMVALAQPKWGRLGPSLAPGHDVVLLVDVSRSMGAEDAVPNRLAVAVEYAIKLVDALAAGPDNRAAVVAFAGRGALRCPMTENLAAVDDVLRRLQPGCVQPGGTDLGAGLDAALEALGTDEHAEGQSIVVLSDGEDLAERWKPRLGRFVQREVIVYGVTIGDSEQGHPVPSGPSDRQPIVYQGKTVESHRSDVALRDIAEQTKGLVIPLGLSTGDPGVLYHKQIEPSARRRAQVPRAVDMDERFPLFLVAALSCLIAACWPPGRGWSLAWPWRLGWGWISPWVWIRRAGHRRRAEAVARAGLVAIAAGLVVGAGQSPDTAPAKPEALEPAQPAKPGRSIAARQAVTSGQAAYEAGRLEDALAAFESAIMAAPGSAIPCYDAAAVLFRMGRYEEARNRYIEARSRADDALRTKIDYAIGNTMLALGDVPAAIEAYDACIASTARGAAMDAVRRDAVINRDFASQQAQTPTIPQGQGSDDPSTPRRPDNRRSPNRSPGGEDSSVDGDEGSGPSEIGPNTEDEAGKDGRTRRRRHRTGGGGGGRTTPPGASGESPEDRLDAALDDIRAAQQSRRLPEEPPPASAGSDGRDW
jgi:Ca-activated chloride channel homolog